MAAEDDPRTDGAAVDPSLARPLLAAAQAATDRLASEVRALGEVTPAPVGATARESLRSLHAALFQLHALVGGPRLATPPRARVDPLAVACEVVDAAQSEGFPAEVEVRGSVGTIDADAAELRRLLRWLMDRAASSVTGAVRVAVAAEGPEVSFELPWHDELSEAVAAQERAWLERAVGSLAGRMAFADGRVRVLLPREASVPFESSLEDLAREVQDLRRARATHVHEVERASCALHSAQLEAEALRRQLSRVEQSAARAVGDMQKVLESLVAMAGLVSEPEGLGRDLEAVAQSGLARVTELVAELDTAAMCAAASVSPSWSAPPASGVFTPPRDLLAALDDERRALGDDDPTPR